MDFGLGVILLNIGNSFCWGDVVEDVVGFFVELLDRVFFCGVLVMLLGFLGEFLFLLFIVLIGWMFFIILEVAFLLEDILFVLSEILFFVIILEFVLMFSLEFIGWDVGFNVWVLVLMRMDGLEWIEFIIDWDEDIEFGELVLLEFLFFFWFNVGLFFWEVFFW